MNKALGLIALAVIIIVVLNLFSVFAAKTESVSSAASPGGIEALITQPTK